MTDNDDDLKRGPRARPPKSRGFAARDGDRPPRRFEGKPRFGGAEGGDRPPRRFEGKPRFGGAEGGDRPPRRFEGKPRFGGAEGGDRPPRRFEGKPRFGGAEGGDRPPRRFEGKPRFGGAEGGDRPPRRFEGKPRFGGAEGGDRPPRRFEGKPRFGGAEGGDRPPRRFEDKPRFGGAEGGDRPPRRFEGKPRFGGAEGGDRPPRRFEGKPRFGGAEGGDRPPRRLEGKPRFGDGERNERPRFDRPRQDKPWQDRGRPEGDRPARFRREDEAADGAAAAEGERIAKVMARAGLCSRRDAEEWIAAGRVAVNGEVLDSPARDILPTDVVLVDGAPLPERERTRLWLYHKPRGLVTTEHDPEGRPTVFDNLPEGLPRVLSIGRLDINTEGLLLLTNDGGLARVLAHPKTAWLRRYRVRVFGDVDQAMLDTLAEGVTIDDPEDGEMSYEPIIAKLERSRGSNSWLTMDLREGKNREIKRVLEHLGLQVTRLIRISFGPFQLGELEEGAVEEIRSRYLRDQLGDRLAEEAGVDFASPIKDAREERAPSVEPQRREGRARTAYSEETPPRRRYDPKKPGEKRDSAILGQRPDLKLEREKVADRKGRSVRVERVVTLRDEEDGASPRRFSRAELSDPNRRIKPRPGHPEQPESLAQEADEPRAARPFRSDGDRPRPPRRDGDRPFRSDGDRPRPPRRDGDRPFRSDGDRPRPPRRDGDRPFRSDGDRPRPQRRDGDRPFRSDGDRPRPPRRDGDRPFRSDGDRPRPPRRDGDRPFRSDGDRPRPPRRDGDRPFRSDGDRPRPPRRDGDRPFRPDDGNKGPRRGPGGGKGADRRR